jgi:hypothetical protein
MGHARREVGSGSARFLWTVVSNERCSRTDSRDDAPLSRDIRSGLVYRLETSSEEGENNKLSSEDGAIEPERGEEGSLGGSCDLVSRG